MKSRPSCTVIVPCYNGASFLPETIGSVLRQTTLPLEIVVVDDGSTDGSADVASAISPLVRVIRQSNAGESVARNKGLEAARGEYVLFLDADDLLAAQSIERLSEAVASRPGAVAVMGVALFKDDPLDPFERTVPREHDFFPRILWTNFGPPHCWFTPRAVAVELGGFRVDLIHSEDWEFWGRVALSGAALVSVPYEGALYRRHPNSQVATARKKDVYVGRLTVAEMLAEGMLERPALVSEHGERMFWSLWAMMRQAERGGAEPERLHSTDRLLERLVAAGPASLRRSGTGISVQWIGAANTRRVRRRFEPAAASDPGR